MKKNHNSAQVFLAKEYINTRSPTIINGMNLKSSEHGGEDHKPTDGLFLRI